MPTEILLAALLLIAASTFGCVRDVQTESAQSFSLESGQTWDWVPEDVEGWQEYHRGAQQARVDVRAAYHDERLETQEQRSERRDEPTSTERREERREQSLEAEVASPAIEANAGDEVRALKREHKHIQDAITGELSKNGISRTEGASPSYYVAYYLFGSTGYAAAAREYANYKNRDSWGDNWDTYEEDTLVIDIVDPATGNLLWSGSGKGNTRAIGNVDDRMRGVKEAVRQIMSDLR